MFQSPNLSIYYFFLPKNNVFPATRTIQFRELCHIVPLNTWKSVLTTFSNFLGVSQQNLLQSPKLMRSYLFPKKMFAWKCFCEDVECCFFNFAENLSTKNEILSRSISQKDGEVEVVQKLPISGHWSTGHVKYFFTNTVENHIRNSKSLPWKTEYEKKSNFSKTTSFD